MNPVRLDPQHPFMRDPLAPHMMRDRLTRTQDLFILCHLGVPRIERDQWSLTIDGMVERPRTLRFNEPTALSKDRGDKCSSMLRQSARAVRASAARLQR